jgi:hypothetical protein
MLKASNATADERRWTLIFQAGYCSLAGIFDRAYPAELGEKHLSGPAVGNSGPGVQEPSRRQIPINADLAQKAPLKTVVPVCVYLRSSAVPCS